MYRTLIAVVLSVCMVNAAFLQADEPDGQDPPKQAEKEELVRQIDLKLTTRLPASRSKIVTPVTIKTQEELEKLASDPELLAKLAEEVDFSTDHLLYFAWGGSRRDQITTEVTETDGKPPHIAFHYKPGMTRDLRPHRLLFIVKQKASWKVDNIR